MKKTLASLVLCYLSFSCSSQKLVVNPEIKDYYDEEDLAQCLVDNGVRTYGAWWCPPCHYQKSLFGKQAWKIMEQNHTECYEEGIFKMKPICVEAGIERFPSIDFQGKRITSVLTLEQLSEFSGCPYGSR